MTLTYILHVSLHYIKTGDIMQEQIKQILNGNDEDNIKLSKIAEIVGFQPKEEVKSLNELMRNLENELDEAKCSYEHYQEYEPKVSQLEYLGFDDQDMELHALRGTMNDYYDEYAEAEERANKIKEQIRKLPKYNEEIEDEIEQLELDYMI